MSTDIYIDDAYKKPPTLHALLIWHVKKVSKGHDYTLRERA